MSSGIAGGSAVARSTGAGSAEARDASVFDVAIVGYGPVGQSLATLLGRRGIGVVVFDRQEGLFPLPRACHLDHETMRILQAMGIADEIDQAIVPATEYHLLRADGRLLARLPRDWETPSGWESSYHFFQPDVEVIFDETAKSTPGVTVRQGAAVAAVADEGDRVGLTLDDGEIVHARFVVGADGANSLVREAAGIPREDLGFEATWVVVDVEVDEGHEVPDIPDTAQVLDPSRPRHMAWLGGRHVRWEFMVLDSDPTDVASPERIWPLLAEWVTPETATMLRSATYTFRSLVAETFNLGRILLAGDAAHVMPPFLGQGMVSGMRDAATLSWILDLVLRGAAPLRLLDAYTLCRRSHVTEFIAESVRVGQMVCETDPVKAAARDAALEQSVDDDPAPFQPRVGGFYVPGPLGGLLSLQPRVGTDARLLDDVLGTGFAVVARDAADLSAAPIREISALGGSAAWVCSGAAVGAPLPDGVRLPGGVRILDEAGTRFSDWLSAVGHSWAIVRPDGYVYDSGSGSEALGASVAGLVSLVSAY